MSCGKKHEETEQKMKEKTGEVGAASGAQAKSGNGSWVFNCPVCGKFVGKDLVCHYCGSEWSCYKDLISMYPDSPQTVNQILQLTDLRAAILPLVLGNQTEDVHVLTPITDDLVEAADQSGKNGVGLLLGGDDIEDMAAQLTVYKTPSGKKRGVLHMKVRADLPQVEGMSSAEDKLLAALETKEPKYITVTELQLQHGKLPYDSEHGLGDKLLQAVKSLNHHFGAPDRDGELKPYVEENIAFVEERLNWLEQIPTADPKMQQSEKEMILQYRATLADLKDCVERAKSGDNNQWRKTNKFAEYLGTYEVEVQVKKEIPPDPNAQGLLAAKINGILNITDDGVLHPPQQLESTQGGYSSKGYSAEGYRITLDGERGWYALYYPHKSKASYCQQGVLQIITPEGEQVDANMVTEAIYRMRQMNLTGTLASNLDAEYLYLARNAWAMGLAKSAEFKKIMSWSEEDGQQAVTLAGKEISELQLPPGLDYSSLPQTITLKAYQVQKLKRRKKLRALIAKKLGISESELVQHPSYMKYLSGTAIKDGKAISSGLMAWTRLDTEIKKDSIKNIHFFHNITGGQQNMLKIIEGGGVIWSTLRREASGINAGSTMSPGSDMNSGGAGYIFTYIHKHKPSTTHVGFLWDNSLVARSDCYWYPSDHFGALNPNDYHYSSNWSTELDKLQSYAGGSAEAMIKNGISIYAQPPKAIVCGSNSFRNQVLAAFKKNGVTHIGDRPIEEVCVVSC